MNDITTQVPEQVRAFAPLEERRRRSRVFADAADHYSQLTTAMETAEQALIEARAREAAKDQQIEFLKEEVRRLTMLNDVHAQNHAALEAGLVSVKDMIMAIDLRNTARVQATTGD